MYEVNGRRHVCLYLVSYVLPWGASGAVFDHMCSRCLYTVYTELAIACYYVVARMNATSDLPNCSKTERKGYGIGGNEGGLTVLLKQQNKGNNGNGG